ncbi:MAG: class II fructose-bisphosphate aldolase [Thermodesulfobacteriota bacterium]
MEFKSTGEIYDSMKGAVKGTGADVEVLDEGALRGAAMDRLIYSAVFSDSGEVKTEARRLIKYLAGALGIRPASIHDLYAAMGRGECMGFTVPAINIRGLTYYTARAVFRAAQRIGAGAFIFEIAKSEIGYTGQRPSEYTACCLAAAIREGHRGPVFIQGDHFQVNAKKFSEDREAELEGLKKLIKEALDAEFCNIDIDASTTVDLSRPEVGEQQRPNYEATAELTKYIRSIEPEGVTVSIGGEIGEVGGKNSTEEELRAFMDGYLADVGPGIEGISKISIQTGTSHGGVVLPDGSIARVKVDFDTIEKLGRVAREAYGLGGVVQHGASTLPDDAFDIFTKRCTAEVHLATAFQNMIYDSPSFPEGLKKEIYDYILQAHAAEKKEQDTEEQFIYKTRKKGFGPFKEKMWNMDPERVQKISAELEQRFDTIFEKLNIKGTAEYVKKWVG